jgi:hypothetical protein
MAKRTKKAAPADGRGPREVLYDGLIAPRMAEIIAICKTHGIPMVASFELDARDESAEYGDPLMCTTVLLNDGKLKPRSPTLTAAARELYPRRAVAFAETITTEPDGSKRVSIRRVS